MIFSFSSVLIIRLSTARRLLSCWFLVVFCWLFAVVGCFFVFGRLLVVIFSLAWGAKPLAYSALLARLSYRQNPHTRHRPQLR